MAWHVVLHSSPRQLCSHPPGQAMCPQALAVLYSLSMGLEVADALVPVTPNA
jgi:hypothetical protein